MKRPLLFVLFCAFSLTGCNEDKTDANGALTSSNGNTSLSVIGNIRPKADPNVVAKIKQEEEERRRQQEEAARQQQSNLAAQNAAANAAADPSNRDLKPVNQDPISGIASAFGFGPSQTQPAQQPQMPPIGQPPPGAGAAPIIPTPPPTASYAPYQNAGSLIPPPPAVSLTTTAAPVYPPPAAADPYGYGYNPYANPYMNPYMQPPPAQAAQPAHPAGSMFSNTSQAPAVSSSDDQPKKKPSIVLITPTGMDPRSPYKQRDDLKMLVKAAFAAAPQKEMHEDKIMQQLAHVDVGLPADASKGSISLTQRQIDNLFRTPAVDKKVLPLVKKIETDLAQSYYRYLYAHNKYMLTQQQVAARKQEQDVADDQAEKQRAAADLSAAQNEAEQAKEDLHASQCDLAAISGAQATRSVITKVSGTAPSLDSLMVASDSDSAGKKKDEGLIGSAMNALNVFNMFGHKKEGGAPAPQAAAPPAPKPVKDKKGGGKSPKGSEATASAHPAATAPMPSTAELEAAIAPVTKPAASANSAISFELKNVQTTPRKSVLKVAIRNNTGDSLNIDPDAISVQEGDHKLAEAAVRSEFESTLVQPNQEISGTITIFGRPWNDRLSVSLLDGGKTITLHR